MVGHGGSSAGSYLADPTSPIPSHCASIVATSTLRVKTCNTTLWSLSEGRHAQSKPKGNRPAHLRLVSLCCKNWPSWLHARTNRFASQSMCMMRLIASNNTAFLALECCTFLLFGGSCALLRMVSRHSVSRFFTVGSSVMRKTL